jgi:hypothetical protein
MNVTRKINHHAGPIHIFELALSWNLIEKDPTRHSKHSRYLLKPEYMRANGILRFIPEDNIEMVEEIECVKFDSTELNQNGVQLHNIVCIVMKLWVPQKKEFFLDM